jgi:glutamate 5-kinase
MVTESDSYDLTDSFDRTLSLSKVRRIVVKVGTRILSKSDNSLDEAYIENLIAQIASIRKRGIEVAIVTSGAVGGGMGSLRMTRRPAQVDILQGLAAIGQTILMNDYQTAANTHGMRVGQVLLTAGDMNRKRDYIHIQNALRALFTLGAIPVINENDSIAIHELRFGDNDSLSAHVSNLINADLLVIFTDMHGLYEGNPHSDPPPSIVRTIWRVDQAVEKLCTTGGSGIGGMRTKLEAAKTLAASGIPTMIAHGREVTIEKVLSGETVGTFVVPQIDRSKGHRRWILARKPRGVLIVDDGAVRALVERHTSLLPSGIRGIEGRFLPGDAVSIVGTDRNEIARGLTAYSSADVRALAGHHTREIEQIVGHRSSEEIIHRDNLAVVRNASCAPH